MSIIIKEVEKFIQDEILFEEDAIASDASLFEGKLLDSLNLVELINFLESKFEIKVNPSEVTTENLDSLGKIEKFVDIKRQKD